MTSESCCILNGGGGAWAFAPLARQLSDALWLDISETPREYNYLLLTDSDPSHCGELFIPFEAMRIASDKRLLAKVFAARGVPTPVTYLVDSLADAEHFLRAYPEKQWCLKYPTGCGAAGHRMLVSGMTLPRNWPFPLVVQEFIRLDRPEVYRLYGANGSLFGWIARRFPAGTKPSPWVAHVRGARYELAGDPPAQAIAAVRAALEATGLLASFGCVDLLRQGNGDWVVLEVGTDGMFNHVDRDLDNTQLELEIQQHIAESFWSRKQWRPWGTKPWRPRSSAVGV